MPNAIIRNNLYLHCYQMKKTLLWLKIIRPQTLFASLCPVIVGLLVTPSISWGIGLLTLLCALALQVLSNLINDYYDFKRGADKAGRVGFKRALAEGEVCIGQMRTAIFITLGIALLSGLLLTISAGIDDGTFHLAGCLPILAVGLTALLFAWLYTATNHSLSYLGIADIFVFLYYGVIATAGTYYLQTHTFSWQSFHAGAVCGLISMCVLIINNLRDLASDKAVGKKTFPVRFGKRAGEIGMLVVVLLMPLFAYWAFGLSWPMTVVFAGLLLFAKTLKAEGAQYNKCLLSAGIVNVIYVFLVVIFCFFNI